jgi:hypothetical protein
MSFGMGLNTVTPITMVGNKSFSVYRHLYLSSAYHKEDEKRKRGTSSMENEYLQPTVAPSPTFEMIQGYQNPAYANQFGFPFGGFGGFGGFPFGGFGFPFGGFPFGGFPFGGFPFGGFPFGGFPFGRRFF